MLKVLFAGMATIVGLAAFIVAFFAGAPTVVNLNEQVRTDVATVADLTCQPAAAATSCSITLPTPHEYAGTSFMTITETAPGAQARTGTLAGDRVTLTVTGLTSLVTYTFDVDYAEQGAEVSNEVNDVLTQTPILLPLALLVAVMLGVVALVMAWGRPGG